MNTMGYCELHTDYMEYKQKMEIEVNEFNSSEDVDLNQMGKRLLFVLFALT